MHFSDISPSALAPARRYVSGQAGQMGCGGGGKLAVESCEWTFQFGSQPQIAGVVGGKLMRT
jgi:hypothetical protein